MPFHLNETTHFDQTVPKKYEKLDDMSSDYCSFSSFFSPKKATRVATFQMYLMFHLFTKLGKTYATMMA
jgi:hypothetical protein